MFSTFYVKKDRDRIYQGDIFKDFVLYSTEKVDEANVDKKMYQFPYIIVVSQDCDLMSYHRRMSTIQGDITLENMDIKLFNPFLPNVLVLPAFLAGELIDGKHLENLFKVSQEHIGAKTVDKIKQNQEMRYHYIPAAEDIPELIVDFKIYFSVSVNDLIQENSDRYLMSLNYLSREFLSQRFANYINRIGLPDEYFLVNSAS